jgi:hypothetical protein
MARPKKANYDISNLDHELGTVTKTAEELCSVPTTLYQEKEEKMFDAPVVEKVSKMTAVKHVIRTIARSNVTTYGPHGELVAMGMTDTENYLNQLITSGWQIFSVQMMNQNEKTFDMLYVLVK